MQVLKFPDEQQPTSQYLAIVFALERTACSVAGERSVLTLQPVAAAKDRILAWIKEGDYDARTLVLPSDSETAFIEVNGLGHGVGKIMFETESGPFQIVPTQTAELDEICAR
jgi:hypothetical protein